MGKNNLQHHCITDKYLYVHVVTLYTQHDLKNKIVVKEKRNKNVYLFNVPKFQRLI